MSVDPSLTFTMQPLFENSPQQGATVVTEGGGLEVVDVEHVRDVDAEAWVYGLRREDM